jgi:putative DNA primase/helicase
MDGDDELVAFLQRAAGYALTGITSEHCLFFIYGTGRNGKSTFAEVILAMMGEYAQKAPSSMLMASRSSAIPNDVARLPGARFVIASEVNQGRSWDEALVKDLTGGDRMVARFLHQELFEFRSTHKLWIYGNHKPMVRGTDDGIWSRIHLVPFTVFIKPQHRDPKLIDKLCQELPGILAWAVTGCMTWQVSGLMLPKAVRDATAQYRSEMDVLGDFLDEQCIIEMENVNLKTTVKALYIEYTEWCKRVNQRPEKKQSFNELMRRRGFDDARGAGNALTWYGVQIRGTVSQGEMGL